MKICDTCGMPIPQSATRCPYCRDKRQDSFSRFETKVLRKIVNFVAWIALIGMAIAGIIIVIDPESISDKEYKTSREYKTSHEELFKSLDAKMKSQQEDVKKKTANPTATTGGKVDKEINTVAPSLQATPQQTVEDAQQPPYTEEEEPNVENEAENGFDTEAQDEPEIGSEKAETKKDPKQQRAFRKAMKKQIKKREKNNRKEMKKNN